LKCVAPLPEFPVPVVHKQTWPAGAHYHQILTTRIGHVQEQRARGVFQQTCSGELGNVLKGPISTIAVQAIREPGGLANINVVESVAIDVTEAYAVVTVNIDAARAIQDGSPMINALQQLLPKRRCRGECLRGDIDQARRTRK